MAEHVPRLATIGALAQRFNVPLHRIEYIVRSRTYIKPQARAGGVRCFGDEAVAQIRHELRAMDARQADRARKGARRD